MRLKDYGRDPKKRKEYVQQPGLLLIGVDISKAKHDACIGTKNAVIQKKLIFSHSRDGFSFFEKTIREAMFTHKCKAVLIAMEPSGTLKIKGRPLSPNFETGDYLILDSAGAGELRAFLGYLPAISA